MKAPLLALVLLPLLLPVPPPLPAQAAARKTPSDHVWRAATPAELAAALPARAPVEKERIETEMRTATGIRDEAGHMIAAVVLITAGYSADGKYSHFLELDSPLKLGGTLRLEPGTYVLGWSRGQDGLDVRVFDAHTGAPRGAVTAHPLTQPGRVESFRIWAPVEHHMIQIGRFMVPYSLEE